VRFARDKTFGLGICCGRHPVGGLPGLGRGELDLDELAVELAVDLEPGGPRQLPRF